jgi:hypothetical protein
MTPANTPSPPIFIYVRITVSGYQVFKRGKLKRAESGCKDIKDWFKPIFPLFLS